MTRSQDGALLLSCAALSSATQCRFIPALSLITLSARSQQLRRNRDADLLGGLEIDHELKLHRLLYGQIGWLSAFQNLVHINGARRDKSADLVHSS